VAAKTKATHADWRRYCKDKAVYGILASVDLPAELRERVLKAGFYVARIHDEVFELDVPANFKPKAY